MLIFISKVHYGGLNPKCSLQGGYKMGRSWYDVDQGGRCDVHGNFNLLIYFILLYGQAMEILINSF